MKPDGQNSVNFFVISKWLLPELSFSDRWSKGTEALGTRTGFSIFLTYCPVFFGAVGLFRSDMLLIFLTWFGHDFPAGQFVSVRSFLIATTT